MKNLEVGELEFHLWVMLNEGLLTVDKDKNYKLTDRGKELKENGKILEYIKGYVPKYQKILDEYEGEGFPEVSIPK